MFNVYTVEDCVKSYMEELVREFEYSLQPSYRVLSDYKRAVEKTLSAFSRTLGRQRVGFELLVPVNYSKEEMPDYVGYAESQYKLKDVACDDDELAEHNKTPFYGLITLTKKPREKVSDTNHVFTVRDQLAFQYMNGKVKISIKTIYGSDTVKERELKILEPRNSSDYRDALLMLQDFIEVQ